MTILSPVVDLPVLIVEDNHGLREVLESILTYEGFRVIHAHNGHEGIRRVREDSPGVVLADVNLGDETMDGWKFTVTARANGYKRPIHITTGYSAPELQEQAKAAGAQSVLQKPYDFNVICDLIREALHPENQHKYS